MSYSGQNFNVHVGSPAADYPMEDIKLIHFHNFESLTTVRGEAVDSPEFMCAGHKWKLRLYPGGTNESDDTDRSGNGFVGLYLVGLFSSTSEKVITVECTFNIKKSDGTNLNNTRCGWVNEWGRYNNDYEYFDRNHLLNGDEEFIARQVVLDEAPNILDHGALAIEVRMRLNSDDYCHDDKPKTNLSDDMLKLFLDENTEDVAFNVKGKILKAHRDVLRAHVPELAELCETYDLSNPMPVEDVKPETFQLMIGFVYGKIIQVETWREQTEYLIDATKQSQSLLYAAGKYGFGALKSKAEAWCVKFLDLDAENAIKYLLHADANSLSLLKEATMKFILEIPEDVMESESFSLLSESPALMTEVMQAMAGHIQRSKRKRGD